MAPDDRVPSWQWYLLALAFVALTIWARRAVERRSWGQLWRDAWKPETYMGAQFALSWPLLAAMSLFSLSAALWQTLGLN